MTPAFFSAETRTYCFFFRKHGEKTIEIRNLLTCAFGKKKEQKYSRRRFLRQKSAASLTGREDFSVLSLCGVVPPPFSSPSRHALHFISHAPANGSRERNKKEFFAAIFFQDITFGAVSLFLPGVANNETESGDAKIGSRDSSS